MVRAGDGHEHGYCWLCASDCCNLCLKVTCYLKCKYVVFLAYVMVNLMLHSVAEIVEFDFHRDIL
jgi:hypothetical protein